MADSLWHTVPRRAPLGEALFVRLGNQLPRSGNSQLMEPGRAEIEASDAEIRLTDPEKFTALARAGARFHRGVLVEREEAAAA